MNDKMNSPHYVSKRIRILNEHLQFEKDKGGHDHRVINGLTKDISSLERKLEKLSSGVSISDHALLRYIQRCMGIDIESIRSGLLNIVKNIHVGDGKYILGAGMYAIMKDGVLATIIDENVHYMPDEARK